MLTIEVFDNCHIIDKAEIMKVRSGIYRIILESDKSRILLSGYVFGVPSSINFQAGIYDFKVKIEGLPNGQYLVLSDEWNNTYYLINEGKFNDNNPRKAVWNNGKMV